MKHRVVPDSGKLSCKLLVYCMELGKSLLKLWWELCLRKNTIPMAISGRMYVIVWWWRCWNITMGSWSLGCRYGLISLLRVLWSSGGIRAAMYMLRRESLKALA